MVVVGAFVPPSPGNAANPIEILPSNGGFALQHTVFKINALGAPGMVPAVAVAGAAATNLAATPGGLPSLINGPAVQADFAARFAIHYHSGGIRCHRFDSQIPGGSGLDVPIQASTANFEHMLVVREGEAVIEECQAIDPKGIFVKASVHPRNSRMPLGENKHFMKNLHAYVSVATRAQMVADGIGFILFWEWSGYDTLSGGSQGFTDGSGTWYRPLAAPNESRSVSSASQPAIAAALRCGESKPL